MEITSTYTKERNQYGRPVGHFTITEAENLDELSGEMKTLSGEMLTAEQLRDLYVERNPAQLDLQAIPDRSEHAVGTVATDYKQSGMCHTEGGWPRDIDPTEKEQTVRYRKKVEKDEEYIRQVGLLGDSVEQSIMQNVAIDIYQEYFEADDPVDHASEPPSAKTLSVFKDPNEAPQLVDGLLPLAGTTKHPPV